MTRVLSCPGWRAWTGVRFALSPTAPRRLGEVSDVQHQTTWRCLVTVGSLHAPRVAVRRLRRRRSETVWSSACIFKADRAARSAATDHVSARAARHALRSVPPPKGTWKRAVARPTVWLAPGGSSECSVCASFRPGRRRGCFHLAQADDATGERG